MAPPVLKKATDTDPGTAAQYGAPDVKKMADIIDGTHPTERIPVNAIEGNSMALDTSQEVTAEKLYQDATLALKSLTGAFKYIIKQSTIAANRLLTIPVLVADDEFVFKTHAVALVNKTIDAAQNTLSNISNNELVSGIYAKITGLGVQTEILDMGSNKIINVTDPTADQDASTKAYVDNAINGIKWKAPVRASTTTNGTLATAFANGQTIDGVTLATNDRILLKDQSIAAENGIYTVNASGVPTRATDYDEDSEVQQSACHVQEGTVNADQGFVLTNDGVITVGTTALVYVQFTGLGQIVAGNYLTKTGNVLDVAGLVASAITDLATEILARSKHTGTQLASTISNLATVVKAYRLDEFAIPTADINLNSKSITNLFKSVHKVQSISSTATLVIDMSKEDVAEIDTLAHAPTITTTGRELGRKKIIHITNGATLRAFTFSESWRWRTTVPANMTASKHGTLSLECIHGTLSTDIVASWVEQP